MNILVITLVVVLIASIAFAGYVWYLVTSSPPLPPFQLPPESYADNTISKPKTPLNLLGYASALESQPWCVPTWYAYRFVRLSDGGYGPLSVWSGPFASCSPTDNMINVGILTSMEYDITSDYRPVVHRQTGSIDITNQGTPVFELIGSNSGHGDYGATWIGIDTQNPAQECPSC